MPPPRTAARGEYIETETGNKISRRASILGPKHIILAGKCVIQHDVLVHGDLVTPRPSSSTSSSKLSTEPAKTSDPKSKSTPAPPAETVSIHLGRYVFVSQNCTLHPPSRLSTSTSTSTTTPPTQTLTYHPLRISEHVYIGPSTHIRAASIGSHVSIGARCTVGNMAIIKDNVQVLDDTIVPANSVWASGSVVGGAPARVVGEVGEAWGTFEGGMGAALVGSRERWASVGNAGSKR